MSDAAILERYRPLFEPRGIIVAGASSHPGKFGFVAAHNVLAHGYAGPVFLVNREGSEVLGQGTLRSSSSARRPPRSRTCSAPAHERVSPPRS